MAVGGMSVLVNYGPPMVPTEPSYYGPHWKVECQGCGGDHVHFPDCEPDGPTLVADGEG